MITRSHERNATTTRRRSSWKVGATVLAMGMAAVGTAVVALPGSASAQTCTTAGATGNSCTSAASATLGGGTLSLTAPTSLTWSGTALATTQTLYDTATTDTSLGVIDLRSPATGWNITASATPFTGATGAIIPDSGTGTVLAIGGDAAAPTVAPSAVCVTAGTCVVPTQTTAPVTYPAFVPAYTAATPTVIYTADSGTGTGNVQIGVGATAITGATDPAEWSMTLPAGLPGDTYTSTVPTTIADAP
jgi:hypothetical protein